MWIVFNDDKASSLNHHLRIIVSIDIYDINIRMRTITRIIIEA
jgi:hypothetical protein